MAGRTGRTSCLDDSRALSTRDHDFVPGFRRGRRARCFAAGKSSRCSETPAWLKVKPKVTLDVVVTGGSSEPIQWGDWGLAVMLDIAYKHPRDGKVIQIYGKPSACA